MPEWKHGLWQCNFIVYNVFEFSSYRNVELVAKSFKSFKLYVNKWIKI